MQRVTAAAIDSSAAALFNEQSLDYVTWQQLDHHHQPQQHCYATTTSRLTSDDNNNDDNNNTENNYTGMCIGLYARSRALIANV